MSRRVRSAPAPVAGVPVDGDLAAAAGLPVVGRGAVLEPGYLALDLLSRGHRLDVYDAWSEARQCRCVVKVARPDRRAEPGVRQRLLEEGELLSRLDHPHWVRLYEVVEEPGPALVLQTLTGATLAAMLDDERRIGPADAMVLGAQVASALGYLHSLGWLHLDLTPGNVVVTGGVVSLIDLSLASRPGVGRRGAGTAGYRSPEQVAGTELSTATDVWGLALLLHEALSGRQPGTSDHPDGAPPLRRRRGARLLPKTLVELVNAGLERRPADRPSLPAMLSALGGVPAGVPARAPDEGFLINAS